MINALQQSILLVGTAAGAITDAKTGYIYDWITYPMIGIGIILSIMQQQWINLFLGAGIFALFFIAYKMGKVGGGDVKIFAGITLLNPTNNPIFLFGALFAAAMSAMIFYSVYYTLKYARKGIKLNENKEQIKKAIIFGTITAAYFAILSSAGLVKIESVIIIGIPLMLGFIFFALQNGIKKNFFEKKIKLAQIEEDEIISESNQKKVLELFKGKLINPADKKILANKKIKEIIVLRNLPKFGPFILVGVIIASTAPYFLINLLFV